MERAFHLPDKLSSNVEDLEAASAVAQQRSVSVLDTTVVYFGGGGGGVKDMLTFCR